MNKLAARIRRATEEKMAALRDAVIEGDMTHEEYLAKCGEHRGLKWLIVELQELTRNADADDSTADFDDPS